VADARHVYIEDRIEERLSSCEKFAEEEFRKPEHRHIIVSIKRVNNSLTLLKTSWRLSGRQHALIELESLLRRQHEIELKIENLDNMFLRDYARDLLDKMATSRRALIEEVRWDVEATKSTSASVSGSNIQD
jgi:hypothetical protein